MARRGVEDINDNPLFHGPIPTENLGKLLRADGEFLLRVRPEDKDTTQLRMSVRTPANKIEHFLLLLNDKKECTYDGKKYPSIEKFVTEYQRMQWSLSKTQQIRLKYAVIRQPIINRANLQLGAKIGEGNFAVVVKANINLLHPSKKGAKTKMEIAVKKLKNAASQNILLEFVEEAERMRKLRHKNVVHVLGCLKETTPYLILTEYCSNGNVEAWMKAQKKNKRPIPMKEKVRIVMEVARGMEYVASRNMVHRDLAARNILLDGSLTCKITDFGLAREGCYEQVTKTRPLAIRWLPPEAIKGTKKIFAEPSDVWSYGVFVWEVLTEGRQPWDHCKDTTKVREALRKGHKLQPPNQTPATVQRLLSQCFEQRVNARPTFKEIAKKLDTYFASMK